MNTLIVLDLLQFTEIYFKKKFPITFPRIVKLCTLERSLGLNYHLKLKLCSREQNFLLHNFKFFVTKNR